MKTLNSDSRSRGCFLIGTERVLRICLSASLFLIALLSSNVTYAQGALKRVGVQPVPEPAVAAILAAFDKYEVVAVTEGHGLKDVDDLILSLIRNPAFPEKVNDLAVECGNSLYQPVLDRYIAGENVPFVEVRKVWRNTVAGPMCGLSGFFEQLFPLVRAINQRLPEAKRLRVLAGDPPVDWNQVKTMQDLLKFNREESIASVMEKEVLSKHRKALMLFGTVHLMHGVGRLSAVSIYETRYPSVTFSIGELGFFDTDLRSSSDSPFVAWPAPALTRIEGTWLGSLSIEQFLPGFVYIDNKDCVVHDQTPEEYKKPMARLVDAFLYVGPQDLRLREQTPADIALDTNYMNELLRRSVVMGFPGAANQTLKEFNQQMVISSEYPLFVVPKPPDPKILAKECLERRNRERATN